MVFASNEFVLFLALCLAASWVAGRFHEAAPKYVIIFASLLFYAYWRPANAIILLASIGWNFLLARLVLAVRDRRLGYVIVASGIVGNLLAIAYYKYFAFLITSLNIVVERPLPVPDIVLPIGISFFTFQQIGFLVDYYRGRVGTPRFADYLFIVAYFPHSIAGPIVRIGELQPQIVARHDWRLRPAALAIGFSIFAIGLFKKTAIADPLGQYLDAMYLAAAKGHAVGFVDAWVMGIGYGFQIYFDFSGYSDMAIGLSTLFGVKLPINFFSPYKAASVREFWRRWHISLSRFLRDYLFIPLGGSRHGLPRTVLALMVTMTLGGLWHGANWTFVIWGLLHGAYLSVNHLTRALVPRAGSADHAHLSARVLSVAATFLAVSFAWVFFRAADVGTGFRLAGAMFGLSGWEFMTKSDILLRVLAYFPIVWGLPNTLQLFRKYGPALYLEDYVASIPPTWVERWLQFDFSVRWAITASAAFLVGWLAISALSPFIYFQF